MLKKLTAILLCVCLIASFAACDKKDTEDEQIDEKSKYQSVIFETPNFKITAAMMSYYFNSYYHNFVESNEEYITELGLDTTESLITQAYSAEYTWFDYFMFNVSSITKERILLAEKAHELGYSITEEQQKAIDSEIETINQTAVNSGIPQAALIRDTYGDAVDEAAIRECMKLGYYASYAKEQIQSNYNFNDEEVNAYFEENKKSYLLFDYIHYQVAAEYAEAAKADFENAETEEDFIELIKKYEKLSVYDTTDEALNEYIEECYSYEVLFSSESDFTNWIYNTEHEAFDVYTQAHSSGALLVAMLLPAESGSYTEILYRDTKPLHNVNSVFFSADEYFTVNNAIAKANEVYESISDTYTINDVIEEYNGGKTSNITYYNVPSEIADWIFDEERTVGEIGVVIYSDSGAYIIEMLEDGIPTWKYEVLEDLNSATYNEELAELENTYSLISDNDNISNVTPVTFEQ